MKPFELAAVASTTLAVSKLAGWTTIGWLVVSSPVLVCGGIGLFILICIATFTK